MLALVHRNHDTNRAILAFSSVVYAAVRGVYTPLETLNLALATADLEIVLLIMQYHATVEQVQAKSCHVLWQLAKQEATRATMGLHHDLPRRLIAAARIHINSQPVQTPVMSAIALLAEDKELCKVFGKLGAVDAVLNVITYPDRFNTEAQQQAVYCLKTLFNNETNLCRFKRAGGPFVLREVAHRFPCVPGAKPAPVVEGPSTLNGKARMMANARRNLGRAVAPQDRDPTSNVGMPPQQTVWVPRKMRTIDWDLYDADDPSTLEVDPEGFTMLRVAMGGTSGVTPWLGHNKPKAKPAGVIGSLSRPVGEDGDEADTSWGGGGAASTPGAGASAGGRALPGTPPRSVVEPAFSPADLAGLRPGGKTLAPVRPPPLVPGAQRPIGVSVADAQQRTEFDRAAHTQGVLRKLSQKRMHVTLQTRLEPLSKDVMDKDEYANKPLGHEALMPGSTLFAMRNTASSHGSIVKVARPLSERRTPSFRFQTTKEAKTKYKVPETTR